jgi:hypothetical protein
MSLSLLSLNAAAVAHFQLGEFEFASHILKMALRQLQLMCTFYQSVGMYGYWYESIKQVSYCYSDFFADIDRSAAPHCAYTVRPLCHRDDTEIYDGAFLVSSDGPIALAETGAVLLFNIGLVDHLQGLQTGRSQYFEKALRMYEQSTSLLESVEPDTGLLLLLSAALLHNISQIYSTHFEMSLARDTAQKLAVVVECMEGEERISDDDFAFFHASVFFSKVNDYRCAPAA